MPKSCEIPRRKILPIIYVIDTSGGMVGKRIGAVNAAMYGAVDVMKDVARKNPNAEIKIGILTFASGAEWVTKDASGNPALVNMEDFFWTDLHAGGLADIGEALKDLRDKMSRSSLFSDEIGYKMPVLIFISHRNPTDDWKGALKKINENNKWFRYSTKVCIAVEGADESILARIAGRSEAVIEVSDAQALEELISVLSITSIAEHGCRPFPAESDDYYKLHDILSVVGNRMDGTARIPECSPEDLAMRQRDIAAWESFRVGEELSENPDLLIGWGDKWDD